MATNNYKSCNHLYLLPDKSKATITNVFKDFCFSGKLSESELLSHNISEEKEDNFFHRVIILISLLIQVFFMQISEPLKKFGNVIEDFLNPGVTQRDSKKYVSILGHSDTRLDLNKEIKRGDARYYPSLSMMAAKLAYENEAVINMVVTQHWNMEFMGFYDFYNDFQQKFTTHAYIFREQNPDGDVIIVAFRGTSAFDANDWSTDFDYSWVKFDGMGKSHLGFMLALGLNKYSHENKDDCLGDFLGSWPKEIEQNPNYPLAYYTIREKLKEIMAINYNPNVKLIITGHSLGAALAILFPSILALHEEVDLLNSLDAIYAFGQPRVGDDEFSQFVSKRLRKYNIKYDRIVYGNDVVTKVSLKDVLMEFKHFGRCIHFNSLYQGKIVEEEKQREENVILWIFKGIIATLINFVVARLDAMWEIIRGFFIGYVIGPYYKEGWFMICLRIIIGIPFPSFINHLPQDYVNSTCLACEDLFS